MSLFRPRKLLNVHFLHFLLSAFSHENPALSSNNLGYLSIMAGY